MPELGCLFIIHLPLILVGGGGCWPIYRACNKMFLKNGGSRDFGKVMLDINWKPNWNLSEFVAMERHIRGTCVNPLKLTHVGEGSPNLLWSSTLVGVGCINNFTIPNKVRQHELVTYKHTSRPSMLKTLPLWFVVDSFQMHRATLTWNSWNKFWCHLIF